MGSGIDVIVNAPEEIASLIEGAAAGEIALAELAGGSGTVSLIITFGDSSSYEYDDVTILDAVQIMRDHGSYNKLLRGSVGRKLS